jgi:hypothetical protein
LIAACAVLRRWILVGFVMERDVGGALARLAEAIDGVLAVDQRELGAGDSVLALLREVARLECVAARQAVAFDDAPEWLQAGAEKSPCWVAAKQRCRLRDARRRLRLGAAVRDMPVTAAAWEAGDIGAEHVDVLVSARTPRLAEAFARDEQVLVDHARKLPFRKFAQEVEYWVQLVDPDDAEAKAKAQRDDRELYHSQSFQGLWFGKWTLDPIAGEIVQNELRRIDQELFARDWAAAKDRLGREPSVMDLDRTPAQRRADALVEMATRSATAPKNGRRTAPLFTALVDYPTLSGRVCELASQTVVTPGSLLPWLDAAYIERIVFGPDSRLLDVGKTTRLFRGGLRRGIQVRDRACTHPLCERPGEESEVDHIEPHAAGGETTAANGRLLCSFHNRLRTTRPWPQPKTHPIFPTDDDADDTTDEEPSGEDQSG